MILFPLQPSSRQLLGQPEESTIFPLRYGSLKVPCPLRPIIFEDAHFLNAGIKAKVENKGQYDDYLRDLEPLREELGIDLKEDLYPEQRYTGGANRA